MKVVFDLDGVLRDLCSYLTSKFDIPYPQNWFWKHKDKDIFQWVKGDGYSTLIYAPTTEFYLPVTKLIENIEIWTCQPDDWWPFTKLWIKTHFSRGYKVKRLTTEEKRQMLDDNPDVILVEDSPNFKNYDRILLINRPYNQGIEAQRIYHPGELIECIKKLSSEEALLKV